MIPAVTTDVSNAQVARDALEVACSARDPDAIDRLYAEDFVDHVNGMTYHGRDGARASVALYRALLPDLRFEVVDQVVDGDRVASRWVLRGTHRGRPVELWGIVISRLRDGAIVEDHAASDSLELVRQIGPRRALGVLVRHWRLVLGRG